MSSSQNKNKNKNKKINFDPLDLGCHMWCLLLILLLLKGGILDASLISNKVIDSILEKKMRGLYFVNIEKASSYLLKWKTVCIDKGNGGLNVRCFSSMNMALLCLSKIKKIKK